MSEQAEIYEQVESQIGMIPPGKSGGLHRLQELGMNVPSFFIVQHTTTEAEIEQMVLPADALWAVRSSASIEDGSCHSFAGQFLTETAVQSTEVPGAIHRVRESALADNVATYLSKIDQAGSEEVKIKMDVIVQQYIEPDYAGVWIGSSADSGILEWVNGPGENLVSGLVTPTTEKVDGRSTQTEQEQLVDSEGIPVSETCQRIQKMLGCAADIEFCLKDGVLWLLQLRNVTVSMDGYAYGVLQEVPKNTLIGKVASRGIVSGQAFRYDLHASDWVPDSILVAKNTTPEDMHAIMSSKALVTQEGGLLSHAAVVSREFEIPCLLGVDIEQIAHRAEVVVDAVTGNVRLGDST